MPPIWLIRHAVVTPDLAVPAAEWPLAPEGHAAAAALAALPCLDGVTAVYCSPEHKARDTAAPLARRHGLATEILPELAELRRGATNLPDRAAYEATVAAAFAEPERSVAGWEPAAAAQRRISACVRALAAQHHAPIAVVSHGLVLALLRAAIRAQPTVDLAAWRALPMPALAQVDGATWRFTVPFQPLAAFLEP